MKKSFRKLKSRRSSPSKTNKRHPTTSTTTSTPHDDSSNDNIHNNNHNANDDQNEYDNTTINSESNHDNGTNNSNNSNNHDIHNDTQLIVTKKSTETLEEAYHRLKRQEFELTRAKKAAAGPQLQPQSKQKQKQVRWGNVGNDNDTDDNDNDMTITKNQIENDKIQKLMTATETEVETITATLIPTSPTTTDTNTNAKQLETTTSKSSSKQSSSKPTISARRTMSKTSIKKDESKIHKIIIRLLSGILMVGVFVSFMFCGHIYICTLIFFTEIMLFRELVHVRYNTFFHLIEETIPLFRTTQWMWFVTAIFYTYSDFVVEVIKSNTSLHYLLEYAKYTTGFAFLLYSTTFVVSIATMHKDHIKFQVNQLCWTILVLCLTVGQLKYIMHNVYNGLIWFALPIMLVVFNDSFAWLGGVTCGRKFIQKELNGLSPNKTWEGFVFGWIGTMIAGWHLARYMAQFTWMTCPTNHFSLFPDKLECELDPIFHEAKQIIPSQIFELFPQALVQLFPGVVDICMVHGDSSYLTACISGEDSHTHHHFELVLKNFYPVQIHALGLSLFASFVAPFGGFLASAIKRAYGLKDFASFIPGHGGMMDRMDCQFLMALCTWVHYNTFVKMATVSVPKMIYMFNNLNDLEQREFLERITSITTSSASGMAATSQ